jgi:hypothetical protein
VHRDEKGITLMTKHEVAVKNVPLYYFVKIRRYW